MKRFNQQPNTPTTSNPIPIKRKIQPVFLGGIGGSGMTENSPSNTLFNSQLNIGINNLINSTTNLLGANSPQQQSSQQQQQPTLSISSTQQTLSVEELTPLPQLKKLNSSAELTPLLRPSDLQNVPSSDSVDMATPQIQKFLCFAVPLSPTCNIDQILVKNSINTKKTLKYAKIQAKFARELRWTQTVASPILLLRANKFWTVCTLEDNNLLIFNTQSGITHLSLHTGATIAFLEIKSDFCLTISINGELSIWDLKKSLRILKTSVGTLLARHGAPIPSLKIVRLCLSTNGLPLIALSNGEVFLFSRSLNSWLCIIVGQQKCGGGLFDTCLSSLLTAMQFIANSLPNGLISLLIGKLQLINDKNKLPVNSQCEEMAASNEEAQLELLLRAAFELESREEYRFLAALYLQKLVKRDENIEGKQQEKIENHKHRNNTHRNHVKPSFLRKSHPIELTIDSGSIRGEYLTIGAHEFAVFKGIPYAAPPVGSLRFQLPELPAKWRGVMNASQYAPMCAQRQRDRAIDPLNLYKIHISEDCLYLNVFAPPQFTNDSYPTIVFLHGGRFQYGSSADYPQHAILNNFVSRKVVFVSLNFRLGPMGFLSTGDSVLPGNLGLWDILLALKWVQINAHVFGGDPNNVLLMGHGSGASAASLLALSPKAEGLFHKIMLMSGTAITPGTVRDTAINATWALDARLHCRSFNSSELLECFKKQLRDEILDFEPDPDPDYDLFVPIIDGEQGIIPDDPESLALSRRKMPIMLGTTRDENVLSLLV
uniref:Carboxylesterase n=1 Tax=Meloidogyne javanica TaxID=6303 RepID=A0A915MYH9_MELJA